MPTKREIEIMKHALGFPKNYRNHYAAGGDDIAACEDLVKKGFMVKRKMHPEVCPDPMFQVTKVGFAVVSAVVGEEVGPW